jgi:hypothetical protein
MRPFLYEEEAIALYVAMEALQRFLTGSHRQLEREAFPAINKRFRIPVPPEAGSKQNISVKAATLPEYSAELFEMMQLADEEDEEEDEYDAEMSLPLKDDLVPKDSFLSLGMMPWERLELLRSSVECYQSRDITQSGEGLPVILIQTSRPKAKTMIDKIQNAGGLTGICFNPGEDPTEGELYDLGILQTEDGTMYLFGEFMEDDPVHITARQKWDQRCQTTEGYCGLIIAKGLTGASRGNPKLGDMMALYEGRSLSAEALGLGLLELMPQFDFE